MKRIITTVTVLLFAFIATAQIAPFKIHNNKVYVIWQGDTLKLGVNPDSSVISGNNRLNMSHDSIYFPHFATGAGDTNILWIRGSDGKLLHLKPSDLSGGGGSGTSFWDSTSSALHPTDTANAVAIGTNAVASGTMLRVNDGSVLFDGSAGTTPASGAGTRLMWIPSKAAFRAGGVSDTRWDDANIGLYSSAFGLDCKASGYASHAEGESTTASGYASHAGGAATTASGYASHAEGESTAANSYILFASGRYNDTTLSTDKSNWVNTDPLFQIGNGSSISNSNDALRILKNGTAYIGDASSTTNPILTVSTTDSTTSIIGTVSATSLASGSSDITVVEVDSTGVMDTIGTQDINTITFTMLSATRINAGIIYTDTAVIANAKIYADAVTLADDSTITLPAGAYGGGSIKAFDAGTIDEYITDFSFNSDGSVLLIQNSTDVDDADTDGKLCVFDSGTETTIKNRLGGSRKLVINITYYK